MQAYARENNKQIRSGPFFLTDDETRHLDVLDDILLEVFQTRSWPMEWCLGLLLEELSKRTCRPNDQRILVCVSD